jgi:hypothetical protein
MESGKTAVLFSMQAQAVLADLTQMASFKAQAGAVAAALAPMFPGWLTSPAPV